ncbi:MAG: rRNA methyltransferase [Chloroflexota bacterium]|nr:rRNA methyltransferase [Chloroflexota bacterium]
MSPQLVRIHAEDADFQYAETLRRNRTKRQRHREFFVEGVRPINLALEHGWEIRAFLYSRERPLSGWAEGVLSRARAHIHYELPLHLMAALSGKEATSELIALISMPPDDPSRIPIHEDLLVVVFDRPASPGNLGTVVRSCDALGAHGLIVTGHAVDVYAPEVVSASAGSLFTTPIIRLPSHHELLPWLDVIQTAIGDFQVVGSSAKADTDLSDSDLTRPAVLVVGNETRGLSEAYRELCDVLVRIPMGGAATSLNVACATSIILYEVGAQRRAKAGRRGAGRR